MMLSPDYYDYKELRARALAPRATQADIDALGEWFDHNMAYSYNGTGYDMDDGYTIKPVYRPMPGFPDQDEIDHWEIY